MMKNEVVHEFVKREREKEDIQKNKQISLVTAAHTHMSVAKTYKTSSLLKC